MCQTVIFHLGRSRQLRVMQLLHLSRFLATTVLDLSLHFSYLNGSYSRFPLRYLACLGKVCSLVFPFSINDTEYGSLLVKRPFKTSPQKSDLSSVEAKIWDKLSQEKVKFINLNAQ